MRLRKTSILSEIDVIIFDLPTDKSHLQQIRLAHFHPTTPIVSASSTSIQSFPTSPQNPLDIIFVSSLQLPAALLTSPQRTPHALEPNNMESLASSGTVTPHFAQGCAGGVQPRVVANQLAKCFGLSDVCAAVGLVWEFQKRLAGCIPVSVVLRAVYMYCCAHQEDT